MRILYGVVGEGMGHAMRSGVVLDHLTRNHQVQVVVSGRAGKCSDSFEIPDNGRLLTLTDRSNNSGS